MIMSGWVLGYIWFVRELVDIFLVRWAANEVFFGTHSMEC